MGVIYTKTAVPEPFKAVLSTKLPTSGVTTTLQTLLTSTKTATGEKVDDWRWKLANKIDCCSPRTSSTYKVKLYNEVHTEIVALYNNVPKGSALVKGAAMLVPSTTRVIADFDRPRADARSKALAKVNSAHHTGSAYVMLGELAQTLQMLRHPLEALRDGMRNYLDEVDHITGRKKIRGINQASKGEKLQSAIAGTYLEYTFGWVPLLKDIQEIMSAVEATASQQEVTRADSKYRESFEAKPLIQAREMAGSLTMQEVHLRQTEYILSTKCALTPFVDHDFLTQSGFDLTSFVPSLWNLLPWSFLLDYFANVNQMLASAFTVRDEVTYVSQTEIIRTTGQSTLRLVAPYFSAASGYKNGGIKHNVMGNLTVVKSDYVRVCTHQLPPFALSFPGLRQGVNIGALLAAHNRSTWAIRGS